MCILIKKRALPSMGTSGGGVNPTLITDPGRAILPWNFTTLGSNTDADVVTLRTPISPLLSTNVAQPSDEGYFGLVLLKSLTGSPWSLTPPLLNSIVAMLCGNFKLKEPDAGSRALATEMRTSYLVIKTNTGPVFVSMANFYLISVWWIDETTEERKGRKQ